MNRNMKHIIDSSTPIMKILFFFFFNDTATTEIYTLSLHDALPISSTCAVNVALPFASTGSRISQAGAGLRSEEHTSELQSPCNLVCRLLLEKKKSDTECTLKVRQTNRFAGVERHLQTVSPKHYDER